MHILLLNMGLPMILPAMYLMIAGLVPIVLIESLIISRNLKISYFTSLKSVTLANIISTVVGIPVTWFLLVCIEMIAGYSVASFAPNVQLSEFWNNLFAVTLGAPWLVPRGQADAWIVFAAMGFLLIPFFFASWYLEYVVMKGRLADQLYELHLHPEEMSEADKQLAQNTKDNRMAEIRIAVRNANLFSYGLLELFVVAIFLLSETL